MKARDIAVLLIAILLATTISEAWGWLVGLETSDRHKFPFVSAWIIVATALLGLFPGFVIAWFATGRHLTMAVIVGAVSGVLNQWLLYRNTLADHSDKISIIPSPQMDDYVATAISQVIYICAFTALGMLLKSRVAR